MLRDAGETGYSPMPRYQGRRSLVPTPGFPRDGQNTRLEPARVPLSQGARSLAQDAVASPADLAAALAVT